MCFFVKKKRVNYFCFPKTIFLVWFIEKNKGFFILENKFYVGKNIYYVLVFPEEKRKTSFFWFDQKKKSCLSEKLLSHKLLFFLKGFSQEGKFF